MKKIWAQMALEGSPHELVTYQSVLEKAVGSAILDLEKALAKGVYTQHKQLLVWTALQTLKQAKETK